MKSWMWGILGTVLLLSGAGFASVGFIQPGLTCTEDDSSAGCPATPLFSGMLGIGLALLIMGIIFVVQAAKTRRPPADAVGPWT